MNVLGGLWTTVQSEPVAAQNLIYAFVAMLTGFGLDWTGQQVSLVTTFTAVALTFLTRKAVTANTNVAGNSA